MTDSLSEPNWPTDDAQGGAAPYADPDAGRPDAGGFPSVDGSPSHSDAVPLYGPRYQRNPSEVHAELRRRHGGVAPVLLEGGIPAWLVLGYREMHHVLNNEQIFARDPRRWREWDRVPSDWPLLTVVGYQPSVMYLEGAEHRRRSAAVSDSLFGVDQFELSALAEGIADELVDGFIGAGETDLVANYALPAPLLVLARVFGMSERESFELLNDMLTLSSIVEDGAGPRERLYNSLTSLVRRCAEDPGANVPTRMLEHSAELTEQELVEDLFILLVAAFRPTADWIANTLRLMLTEPRFAASLSGGRSSVGQALNEVLWEDTPIQNTPGRFASRNTQLGGHQIKAGDMLVLGLAAANKDPQVRPETDDGTKGNQAQMSFCHGEHGCPQPAPELAEVIAKAVIEVLLDRLPDVVLAVPPDSLTWVPSILMRSLTALPVRYTPVPAG